jgi:hypothetical protein
MSLRVLAALGALALCSIAAVSAHAAQRSQCQRLRGVDRAPDRQVKLVKRLNGDRLADGSRGSQLVGCVLPRGRVHTIAKRASVDNDLAQEFEYMICQVAGRTVLLDQHGTEGGYASAMSTVVANLGSGRSYTIARISEDKYYGRTGSYARNAFVTRDGRAVAALPRATQTTLTVEITSFAPDGTPRLLDVGAPGDLPRESLTLTGHIASWTHAGEPRRADIRASAPS